MSEALQLFEEQPCPNCGVRFGVPIGFTEKRREDKRAFYCPNGHSMSFHESTTDKLRRERDQLKQNEAFLNDQIAAARAATEAAERRVAAAKGQITKMKKRASNGVCPCCNRSFSDLARHMHSKHPGFVQEPDATETVSVN